MEIRFAVLHIHPTLQDEIDYTVQDFWNWPQLTWLNTQITEPTQAELETAWIACEKEIDITAKLRRLQDINKEIIELWWANALVWFERFETIRLNKISVLEAEVATIKTDLDQNYEETLVDSLITSLFG